MDRKVLKVILTSLIIFLLPSNLQLANSSEILWNPAFGYDLGESASNLVPGAKIRTTGLLVYKSNPDELVMQVIMADSFEDRPFSGKGRNMAMWIYWPKNYCWSKDKANCEGLYTIPIPHSPVNYPTTKSSEFVTAFSHNKVSNVDRKATECKAPWWISSTFKTRDTWNFAVSITCLKLPQEFGWYAYSSIDLGQKDIATDFTSVQMIKYPFHDLAAKNYKPTLENNYSFLYVEKKINYIQTSLTRSKNLLKNSKNKDKKLLEKQILGIESNILKYRDILKNIKSFNTLIYEPTVISINTVTNSIIAQVNALNKILKIPFIKPDIIEYSGKLDRPSYMKGDIARFWIEGKDLDGVPIPDGSKLAISEKELVLNISPNSFVVAPLSSDVASNGRWEYKLVINGNPGINSITLKIGNNIEQKINFAVN